MRVSLRGCGKTFVQPGGGELTVLRGVDLEVGSGEVVAVVGRSGSGKSTLLHLVGLLTEPTSGEYLIDDVPVAGMSEGQRSLLRGRAFGFVFQEHMLLPRLDAMANVLLPFAHGGPRARTQRRRAAGLLARVGLSDRGRSLPAQLSGGQRQRVAIARALVRDPAVVLADEPTGSLDADTAAAVLALLLEVVAERRASLILATHDAGVAAMAHRTVEIAGARVAEAAPSPGAPVGRR